MDELFPTAPQVLTVSELTRSIRSFLETEIGQVWVEGEISNYRKQASGHQYFTLKDEKCQLACVRFHRSAQIAQQPPLADGMHVQVRGMLTVYEARGQYQLNVNLVQAAGAGLLQAKFEALKKKLDAEGLFDTARKRTLPAFPAIVGIVTSPTGAAVRDMLNILQRRAPWMRIIINPVRVQGEGAAEEIARAVAELNDHAANGLPAPDVIVVCRGGGSIEDLWAFNEETVARAIFASAIPVVSAVGHEIDFTIADFTADLRAPTPSAAAELIAPDAETLLRHTGQVWSRAGRALSSTLARERERLAFIRRGALFREPAARLSEWGQRADHCEESLRRAAAAGISEATRRLAVLSGALRERRPDQMARLKRQQIEALLQRMGERIAAYVADRRHRLQRAESLLTALTPEATLRRGYTITTDAAGKLIRSAAAARKGMKIHTRWSDGVVVSRVEKADG